MKFKWPGRGNQPSEDPEVLAGEMGTHPEGYLELREAHYERFFGPMGTDVYHSTDINPVHVDVNPYPPTEERPFWTLITNGMSNMPQLPPDERDPDMSSRTEILLYAESCEPWMVKVLKGLAEMPFLQGTFLYYGHTVPNGQPMTEKPSLLTSFFLVPAVFEEDEFLDLVINGDKVDFLWMVPITEAERAYAQQHGSRALMRVMQETEMNPVIDESRKSMV